MKRMKKRIIGKKGKKKGERGEERIRMGRKESIRKMYGANKEGKSSIIKCPSHLRLRSVRVEQ